MAPILFLYRQRERPRQKFVCGLGGSSVFQFYVLGGLIYLLALCVVGSRDRFTKVTKASPESRTDRVPVEEFSYRVCRGPRHGRYRTREWNRMEAPSLCLRSASSWEGKAPGGESRQVHFQSLRSTLTPHSTALDGHRHRHDALLDSATWFRSTLLYSGCSPPRRPSAPRPAPSAAAGANLPTTRSTRRTTSGDDAGGWSTWTTPR